MKNIDGPAERIAAVRAFARTLDGGGAHYMRWAIEHECLCAEGGDARAQRSVDQLYVRYAARLTAALGKLGAAAEPSRGWQQRVLDAVDYPRWRGGLVSAVAFVLVVVAAGCAIGLLVLWVVR